MILESVADKSESWCLEPDRCGGFASRLQKSFYASDGREQACVGWSDPVVEKRPELDGRKGAMLVIDPSEQDDRKSPKSKPLLSSKMAGSDGGSLLARTRSS